MNMITVIRALDGNQINVFLAIMLLNTVKWDSDAWGALIRVFIDRYKGETSTHWRVTLGTCTKYTPDEILIIESNLYSSILDWLIKADA